MPVLILTGMHRSGTSLVASLFAHAGVALGAQLLAPQADNPFGFFEDVDFLEFHENALHARGQNILVTRDFIYAPDPDEVTRARELIAARRAHALWGWKDPRTSLFLDLWHTLLPDARYLFVYRHPFDVMLSLARRDEVVGFDFYAALDAWYMYNVALVEFARKHPDAVLVCSSLAAVAQIETFLAALQGKTGMELNLGTEQRDAIFRAEQFRRTRRSLESDALLDQIHPDAMGVYQALQEIAALSETAAHEPASPQVTALSRFTAQLPTPLSKATRRALLTMLVALLEPDLYETFTRNHVLRTNELDTGRRAWEQTAQERARLLREQSAWAEPRMKDLERLEANGFVRALKRLGLV